jgi:hypothetical protein
VTPIDDRLAGPLHKHRRMVGSEDAYRISQDGLIVARPRAAGAAAPLRRLALLLLGAVAYKVVLLAIVGEEAYGSRVAALASGGVVERASAWVMQADPATVAAAEILDDLAR